jgi:transposase-like protein
MELFKGTNLIEFIDRFDNTEKCKKYLAEIKWANGFVCSKCSHAHCWRKKNDPFVRVCKGCRHIESVTANTLFHKVKFDLRKAFLIIFEMSTTTKGCSSPVIARKYGINQKTAWLFMYKVRKAMAGSGQHPIEGRCEVDETLIGGHRKGKPGRGAKNKKKVSIVVERDNKGGIHRSYGVKIEDFSTQQLQKIFDSHIDKEAKVETDLWRSYTPLAKQWNITQSKSKPTENFITVHRFIQQLKSWIRGIYHWISQDHLQGYLDEFCFRLNRHLIKGSIFNILINRMMDHRPVQRPSLSM